MLRRYLYALGARADRLDDLVQDVFVLALEKDVEDHGPQAVGSYLRGVAKNMLLRERRSAGARREVEIADETWREEYADGNDDQLLDALRACVSRLPPRSRALLERAYGDGDGRAAIGAEFGIAAAGVKTALRRLRANLKVSVERFLRGPR
ncbi:MAG: RNA polymerase sigma factor (sigma-70 family) [Planctomycetota bacterium]|jgi:RNA polymerase sigma factor (sigma-70 family)